MPVPMSVVDRDNQMPADLDERVFRDACTALSTRIDNQIAELRTEANTLSRVAAGAEKKPWERRRAAYLLQRSKIVCPLNWDKVKL